MKIPFIIYADTESLLEQKDTCHSNPEKSSKIKINKHTILVIHYLRIVLSIPQKTSMTIIKVKMLFKSM